MTVGILCLLIFRSFRIFLLVPRRVASYSVATESFCFCMEIPMCKMMDMKAEQPKRWIGLAVNLSPQCQIHPLFYYDRKEALKVFFLSHLMQYQTWSIEGAGKTLKAEATCAPIPPVMCLLVNRGVGGPGMLTFWQVSPVTQQTISSGPDLALWHLYAKFLTTWRTVR